MQVAQRLIPNWVLLVSSPEAAGSMLLSTKLYGITISKTTTWVKTSSFIHWLCLKFYLSVSLLSPLECSAVKALSRSFLRCRRASGKLLSQWKCLWWSLTCLSKSVITMKDGTTFGYDRSTANIFYAEREERMRCSENYLRIRVLSFNI